MHFFCFFNIPCLHCFPNQIRINPNILQSLEVCGSFLSILNFKTSKFYGNNVLLTQWLTCFLKTQFTKRNVKCRVRSALSVHQTSSLRKQAFHMEIKTQNLYSCQVLILSGLRLKRAVLLEFIWQLCFVGRFPIQKKAHWGKGFQVFSRGVPVTTNRRARLVSFATFSHLTRYKLLLQSCFYRLAPQCTILPLGQLTFKVNKSKLFLHSQVNSVYLMTLIDDSIPC